MMNCKKCDFENCRCSEMFSFAEVNEILEQSNSEEGL